MTAPNFDRTRARLLGAQCSGSNQPLDGVNLFGGADQHGLCRACRKRVPSRPSMRKIDQIWQHVAAIHQRPSMPCAECDAPIYDDHYLCESCR